MTQKDYQPKIIVSLTSYPKRIDTLHLTIISLLKQSVKPYKIVLWLAEEQFPEKDKLPAELTDLQSDEFEICWCEDLKPHKKYYYTFLRYPEECVITVDDDCIYPLDLVETLYHSYSRFPQAVSAMRVRIIDWDEKEQLKDYSDWMHADDLAIGIPAMDLLPIGCGGVIYPPHIFSDELFNKEYIVEKCLYADDLWLKVMHAVQMVPVVLASKYRVNNTIDGTQKDALWNKNSTDNYNIMIQLIHDYDKFRTDGIRLKNILIGKYGTSIGTEMKRQWKEESDKVYQQLYSAKTVIIYGAGFYGKKTYDRVKTIKELEVLCFAVSTPSGNPQIFEGKPVVGINDMPEHKKDCLVLVAMDTKHHNQILGILSGKGFHNYLLITDTVLKLLG